MGFHVLRYLHSPLGGTKGIGKAIVESFLAEGTNVSYLSRSAKGDEFLDFQDATNGARAVGTSVDICDKAAVENWVKGAAKDFGRIDLVVANAASFCKQPTVEDWEKSFQGDIIGLLILIETALPHLEEADGKGSIVVISSLAGFEAPMLPVLGPYGPIKRAQVSIVKSYAHSLGPKGIRMNAIVPGAIETPSLTLPDGTEELSTFGAARKANPGWIQTLIDKVALRRPGVPQDIANAVIFLGSPLSAYTTGATLFVDGAMSISL
ncbi:Fc.00g105860.m01.CDS01 [Cosmosporella sp. VM-42]